jgi:tetratricopeptide (TPR) repeat protein
MSQNWATIAPLVGSRKQIARGATPLAKFVADHTPRITPIFLSLIFLLFTIPLIAQPDDPIRRNRVAGRLPQALFLIQSQAQQTGWTNAQNQLMGDIYYQMDDLPRAVAYWERANIDDPDRLRLLADGYLQLNQWEAMAQTLERILSIMPDDEWALWYLGAIYAPLNPPRSRELLTPLLTSPTYGIFAQTVLQAVDAPFDQALQIGLVMGSLEQWELAEYAFIQTTIQLPHAGVGWAYVGLARHMQGKPAQSWFDQALKRDPQNHQIYYVYSIYLRGIGDLRPSQQAIITAIALNPNNPAYYIELAMSYYAMNNTQQGDYWMSFAQAMGGDSQVLQNIIDDIYAQRQARVFNFDALNALLEATPELTAELTPEATSQIHTTPSSP